MRLLSAMAICLCMIGCSESLVSVAPPKAAVPVDEPTRVAVIKYLLTKTNAKSNVVEGANSVYVNVEDPIFAKLPKVVNGLVIRSIVEGPMVGMDTSHPRQVSYLTWGEWERNDDLIRVTETAHFSSGNSGGCTYEVKSAITQWEDVKVNCFAMAT